MANSGGPPAHGRWAGGASPPLNSNVRLNDTNQHTVDKQTYHKTTKYSEPELFSPQSALRNVTFSQAPVPWSLSGNRAYLKLLYQKSTETPGDCRRTDWSHDHPRHSRTWARVCRGPGTGVTYPASHTASTAASYPRPASHIVTVSLQSVVVVFFYARQEKISYHNSVRLSVMTLCRFKPRWDRDSGFFAIW